MRPFMLRLSLVAALLIACTTMLRSRPVPDGGARKVIDADIVRVREHLTRVEAELRAADVSALSSAQRAARERNVELLRGYRLAGIFPHNHTVAGRLAPVFVDEHGTHCAVGYLIARSGRDDIVAHIRALRNNATVPELADEPGLAAWLDRAGITLAEAARIQPAYGPIDPPAGPDHAYRTATIVGAGLGAATSVWNLLIDRNASTRPLAGTAGVIAGLGELAIGVIGTTLDEDEHEVGGGQVALNLGVGFVSTLLGGRSLLRRPDAATGADAPPPGERMQWTLSPWLPSGTDRPPGVRLALRF